MMTEKSAMADYNGGNNYIGTNLCTEEDHLCTEENYVCTEEDYVCTIVENGMPLIGYINTMNSGTIQHGHVVTPDGSEPTLVSNALLEAALGIDYPFRANVCWWTEGPSMLVCVHVYLIDNNIHVLNLLKQDPMSYLGPLFYRKCFVCHMRHDMASHLPQKAVQLIKEKSEEFHAHPLGWTEIPLPFTEHVILKCAEEERVLVVGKQRLPYQVPMVSRYFPPGKAIVLDAWNLDVVEELASSNSRPMLILTDPRRLPQFESAFPHAVINSPNISTLLHVGCCDRLALYAHTQWKVIVVDNVVDNNIHTLRTTAIFWRISNPKWTMEQVASRVLGYAPVHPQEVNRLWTKRLVHCAKPTGTAFVFEEHVLVADRRPLEACMPALGHSIAMVDSSLYPRDCWKSNDQTCAICMDSASDSHLQCGHSFCTECLQRMYEQAPSRATHCCPMCRATVTTHYVDSLDKFLCRIMPPRATAVWQWLQEYNYPPDSVLCLCSGERVKVGMQAMLPARTRCFTWEDLKRRHMRTVRHIVCFRGSTEEDMRMFRSNYRQSGITFEQRQIHVHVF